MFILTLATLLTTQVLDFDMEQDERNQTGISKLSDKEKAALQCWIDNLYAKRAEPLALIPAKKNPLLQENLQNGSYIKLSDNTIWNIRPSDTPVAQGWITPAEILVSQSGDTTYPNKLTNSITGSSVLARKVTSIPPTAPAPIAPATPTTPTPPTKK